MIFFSTLVLQACYKDISTAPENDLSRPREHLHSALKSHLFLIQPTSVLHLFPGEQFAQRTLCGAFQGRVRKIAAFWLIGSAYRPRPAESLDFVGLFASPLPCPFSPQLLTTRVPGLFSAPNGGRAALYAENGGARRSW